MKSTVDLAPPRRERREAFLKARWKEELVARFEQIARERGQTGAEVLRFLALGYIADKRQN